MSWFYTKLFSTFLLPPLNLLVLAVIGLWLWHKRPFMARVLLSTSFGLLWLFSTPYVAEGLLHALEGQPHVPDTGKTTADAIVVLGGSTYFHAPEYGGSDTVNEGTLVRLRYAARLYRETGKPILVSGGAPAGNAAPEAVQMKAALEEDFKVPVRWTEGASNDTVQNARFSWSILEPEGIRRIYLVTHASHMPRARRAFADAGFEVMPAPTAYTTRYQIDLLAFVPNAYALRDSRIFMHELIGLLLYQLKSQLRFFGR